MYVTIPHLTLIRNTYYFRIAVPKDLREKFGRREIKRSLGTRDLDVASQLSRALRLRTKETFRQARMDLLTPEECREEDREIAAIIQRWIDDCMWGDEEQRVRMTYCPEHAEQLKGWISGDMARDTEALRTTVPGGLDSLGAAIVLEYGLEDDFEMGSRKYRKLCREATKASIAVSQAQLARWEGDYDNPYDVALSDELLGKAAVRKVEPQSSAPEPSPTIADLQRRYVQEHVQGQRWDAKTTTTVEAVFRLVNEVLGAETAAASISYDALRDLRDNVIMRLPPNRNKVKRYRDKSIKEILQMDDVKPMAFESVRKNCVWIATFFKWCYEHDYIPKNPATRLVPPKQKRAASTVRAVFSPEDLTAIAKELSDVREKYPERPERYWVPLVSLYSGMRLTEICQLYLDDIVEHDGIWCFKVNKDSADKKVKSVAGWRIVPIHSTLLQAGFLDYVKELRAAGEERLWPRLPMRRDGYGQDLSRWFGRFLRNNITKDSKKVFHSFRHTFINQLKQLGISEVRIAELVGHQNENITTGRYGKRFEVALLQETLEKLEFVEFASNLNGCS